MVRLQSSWKPGTIFFCGVSFPGKKDNFWFFDGFLEMRRIVEERIPMTLHPLFLAGRRLVERHSILRVSGRMHKPRH